MQRNVLRPDSANVAGTRKKSQLHDMRPAPDIVRRMGRAGRGGEQPLNDLHLYAHFGKLRKASISFVMSASLSVRPSVRPSARNNSALSGRIFLKFDI